MNRVQTGEMKLMNCVVEGGLFNFGDTREWCHVIRDRHHAGTQGAQSNAVNQSPTDIAGGLVLPQHSNFSESVST